MRTVSPSRPRPAAGETRDELGTTLSTLTLFQGAVQHADDKARTVMAVQTALTATVAAQLTFLAQLEGPARVAQLVALAIFAAAYLQSACDLLRALTPRTVPTSGPNKFAFPSVAVGDRLPHRLSLRDQCRQAHEVGQLLAGLAMAKHRLVRRAMYGTWTLFASALVSLAVAVVP